MDSARHRAHDLLPTVLAVVVLINVLVVLLLVLGVGWQELLDVPSRLWDRYHENTAAVAKNPLATRSTTSTATRSRTLALTSGVVNDPNVKLVCSDESFSTAVAKVRTAVVNVSTTSSQALQTAGPPVARFEPPAPDVLGGIGSGIVLHPSGYILTCLHVVSGATSLYVTPFGPSFQRLPARLIASDESLNLAVLRVTTRQQLPAAPLGESARAEVADVVLAIGSPFGLEQSVTHGIISDNARNLAISGRVYRDMFQMDVPINRGSSGGPLINLDGEVIAINMAIYSPTNVYNGVSFALPIDKAKPFIARTIPQENR